MKYNVRITQTLEGYVDIEAASPSEALEIADQRFRVEGEELPQMEDCTDLEYEIADSDDAPQ